MLKLNTGFVALNYMILSYLACFCFAGGGAFFFLILLNYIISFFFSGYKQVAGSLSASLGLTMDQRHQSEREQIHSQAVRTGDHLVAGVYGLAHGTLFFRQLHAPM